MGFAHLHAFGRDVPLCGVQINFGPFGLAQLAGAHEHQRGEAQGIAGGVKPGVIVNGAQQGGDFSGFGNRGQMGFLRRRQCALQVARGVAFGPASGHGIAEHLPGVLHGTMRRFQGAARFDLAQGFQQFGRLDVGNGLGAQPGEDVALKAAQDAFAVAGCPLRRKLGVPLAGDDFKAVCAPLLACGFLRLALFAGVNIVRQQLARFVAALTGRLQAHIGIDAKG